MKLSAFISSHIETILIEWESFARTLQPAGAQMSRLALRDHAKLILEDIAASIDTPETPGQQYQKSRGEGPQAVDPESAAATHGTLRHSSGFTLIQLTAEFRALRATVLRMWLPNLSVVNEDMAHDMIRFNEAIDQALAESVVTYSSRSATTRDTFLAILGHDLRSPLATVTMAGSYLARAPLDESKTREVAGRILRSAGTMTAMVNDLLEYARTQLDGEIPVAPGMADMLATCRAALDDAQAAHADCRFEFAFSGDLQLLFDRQRMQQVFSNLLNNAAQYRAKDSAVALRVTGDADEVVITVGNHGPPIPPESLGAIFAPMVRLASEDGGNTPSRSIGLGLFIAREITLGHGGTLGVTSNAEDGTVFTVRLPRAPAL